MLTLLTAAMCLNAAATADRPPNIIFIYTDDQAAWSIGASGNRDVKTPNIDRLGAEGARLTNCFAATPVCSPARAAMMASRYGTEVGITDWINPVTEPELGLDPAIVTWPRVLAEARYDTALLGKWHLGTQDRFHPTRFGFKRFIGFRAGSAKPKDPTLEINGKPQQLSGFLTAILSDYAAAYIREQRDRPFLLCVNHRSPHSPYTPVADDVWEQYKASDPLLPLYPNLDVEAIRTKMREYLASVAELDRGVGTILEALKQSGQEGNTIVVYTSDQGYNIGHHGVLHKGNATWMTLDKRNIPAGTPETQRSNIFDTSLRVPCAIRWPARIKPGMIVTQTISGVDWFPTFVAAAGAALPKGQPVRGRDFTPLLRGERIDWNNDLYAEYSQHHYTSADLRMYRTPEWKLVRDFRDPARDELYHLAVDPDEAVNLIASPEASTRQAREDLDMKLGARMRAIKDPILRAARPRQAGQRAARLYLKLCQPVERFGDRGRPG